MNLHITVALNISSNRCCQASVFIWSIKDGVVVVVVEVVVEVVLVDVAVGRVIVISSIEVEFSNE